MPAEIKPIFVPPPSAAPPATPVAVSVGVGVGVSETVAVALGVVVAGVAELVGDWLRVAGEPPVCELVLVAVGPGEGG